MADDKVQSLIRYCKRRMAFAEQRQNMYLPDTTNYEYWRARKVAMQDILYKIKVVWGE